MANRSTGYNKRRKELRYLKAIQPGYTSLRPNDLVVEHCKMLLSYGWTVTDIERKAGVGKGVVSEHLLGTVQKLRDDTEAAILGVKLTELDLDTGPGLTTYGRALGGHRIVTGLARNGWSYHALETMQPEWSHYSFQRYAQRPKLGRRSQLSKSRYLELRAFAQRLEGLDPVKDAGADPKQVRHVIAKAKTQGYAPIGCWDLETIHLPESRPEWTGACGTAEGYRIHIRETVFEGNWLPLCDACRAAVESRPPDWTPTVVLRRENFIQALKDSPRPVKAIAREVLGEGNNARDTLYRWRDGSRNPRNVGLVQRLADALDVPVSHLLDEDAMQAEASAPAVGHGEFNPYVLRAAMEMGGMSQHRMSLVPGMQVSAGAIGKWLKGEMKPTDKSKVKPIARHFGVDVEVFFQ